LDFNSLVKEQFHLIKIMLIYLFLERISTEQREYTVFAQGNNWSLW